MANWWFGARWFGIRIRIPLTNNPFHFRGSQKSKPRGPNQTTKLTIKNSWLKGVLGTNKNKLWNKKHKLPGFGWFQMGFKGWFGMFISNPVTEVQFTHLLCFAKGENVPRVGVQRKDESGTRDEVVDLGSTIPDVLERGDKPKGLRKGACCSPWHVFVLFFLLVKIFFRRTKIGSGKKGFLQVWFQGLRITIWTLNIDTPFLPSKSKSLEKSVQSGVSFSKKSYPFLPLERWLQHASFFRNPFFQRLIIFSHYFRPSLRKPRGKTYMEFLPGMGVSATAAVLKWATRRLAGQGGRTGWRAGGPAGSLH